MSKFSVKIKTEVASFLVKIAISNLSLWLKFVFVVFEITVPN